MTEERNTQNGQRDDVGTLLRVAGKRKPVPQERFDRVRAAAHEEWQRQTRARSQRRTTWAVAGLLAAASLITVMLVQFRPSGGGGSSILDATIRVEALNGTARAREPAEGSDARSREVTVGDEIPSGAELSTADSGRAALRLASGHSVRLDASTRVRWLGRNSFELESGAVYVDSGTDAPAGSTVEILTPFGTVQEIGTQYEVRLIDDSLRLRLREGAVVLRQDERVHEVLAGAELQVAADGRATRRPISISGPGWDWVAAIAPLPELQGRPAREFLEWVARERGWKLNFADESLARSADEILLEGSFSQLSLDQALDAILPTCRMTYRVEQGTLIVGSESGGRW